MDSSYKTGIALAVIALATGVLAGFLVVTVDFSSVGVYLWVALVVAVIVTFVMVVLTYKRGKIPLSV